jgi:hypothetical protein
MKSFRWQILLGLGLIGLSVFLYSFHYFLFHDAHHILSLLHNPNLLEHDSFTNMLWAVFHLTEELAYRPAVIELDESDYKHLCGDIERAYRRTARQWTSYMRHLKNSYPYLFSLAMRTNPFNPQAIVTVK